MNDVKAFFCEWEKDGACITYPVVISHDKCDDERLQIFFDPDKDHDDAFVGTDEGEFQLPESVYAELAPELRSIGYRVAVGPVDRYWMSCWADAPRARGHWHPKARTVSF